ncbi:hypothetical protein [Haladaptatus sp. NG-SE-30]
MTFTDITDQRTLTESADTTNEFAASTAFMTPVGYQTNLFVYGPGGYKFSDFIRVGAPLQLLLSVVTVLGIAFFWGVRV